MCICLARLLISFIHPSYLLSARENAAVFRALARAPLCVFLCSEWAEDSLKQKRVCAPPSHLHGADGNLLPR